jgi:hypothetical protein
MAKRDEKSLCERCGRVSYTVRGVCTECGAVKDITKAIPWRRRPPGRGGGGGGWFGAFFDFLGCLPWALILGLALIWLGVARRRPARR